MDSLLCNNDALDKIYAKEITYPYLLFYGLRFESDKTRQSLGLRITSNGLIFEGIINKNSKCFGRLIQGTEVTKGYYKYTVDKGFITLINRPDSNDKTRTEDN